MTDTPRVRLSLTARQPGGNAAGPRNAPVRATTPTPPRRADGHTRTSDLVDPVRGHFDLDDDATAGLAAFARKLLEGGRPGRGR